MSISPLILHQSRSLTLRRTIPEDAPFLFEKMYSRYEFMRLFRLNDSADNVAQVRERLIEQSRRSPAETGYLECLIIHKTHGPIGMISAAGRERHKHAELLVGIFDKTHHNSFYGLEACAMMFDLSFNAYDFHRLFAYVYGYNLVSQQALAYVGFTLEGIMKDHLFDPVSQNYVDLYIYGITVDQFRQSSVIARLSKRLIGRDITQPLTAPLPPPKEITSPSIPPAFVKSGPKKSQ